MSVTKIRAARKPCPGCGKPRDICMECRAPARIADVDDAWDTEAVHVTDDGTQVVTRDHEARVHGGCMNIAPEKKETST